MLKRKKRPGPVWPAVSVSDHKAFQLFTVDFSLASCTEHLHIFTPAPTPPEKKT